MYSQYKYRVTASSVNGYSITRVPETYPYYTESMALLQIPSVQLMVNLNGIKTIADLHRALAKILVPEFIKQLEKSTLKLAKDHNICY